MDMFSYLLGKSSGGGKGGLKVVIVEELPTTGEANTLYLVPRQVSETNNVFDEYLYVDDDWEKVGTTDIDISGKQDTFQFTTLPTANADNLGKIYQYIGTTNANYTNGYFYICLSDGEATPTYSWTNINVQPNELSLTFNYSESKPTIATLFQPVITQYLAGKFYDITCFKDGIAYKLNEVYTYGRGYLIFVGFNINMSSTTTSYGINYSNTSAVYITINYDTTTGTVLSAEKNATTNLKVLLSTAGMPLGTTNTNSYTPTSDYHPATKKYVDDLVGNINTVLATLTTPSNNGGN